MRIKTIAAVMTVVLSAPALASADVAPTGSTDRLKVEISGHISPSCSLAMNEDSHVHLGDIQDGATGAAAETTATIPFSMSCNTAFTTSLKSRHGGLAFDGAPSDGFSSLVDYTAVINLPAGGGVSLTCDAAQMRESLDESSHDNDACKARSVTNGYSAGQGAVKVTTQAGGKPLLLGTYSDELILCISPNLGGGSGI